MHGRAAMALPVPSCQPSQKPPRCKGHRWGPCCWPVPPRMGAAWLFDVCVLPPHANGKAPPPLWAMAGGHRCAWCAGAAPMAGGHRCAWCAGTGGRRPSLLWTAMHLQYYSSTSASWPGSQRCGILNIRDRPALGSKWSEFKICGMSVDNRLGSSAMLAYMLRGQCRVVSRLSPL